MRIGIFGGSFDPPHLGHLILAEECRYQLRLDRVLWVLTPDPPHKKDQKLTSAAVRLQMIRTTIRYSPQFELSTVELDRPGPHYAVDTMRILHGLFPKDRLIYLMGGDSLRDLDTWYLPHDFIRACDEIGVMRRLDDEIDFLTPTKKFPDLKERLFFVKAPILEISSRQIRQRVKSGDPFRYYLPECVFKIINNYHLYET